MAYTRIIQLHRAIGINYSIEHVFEILNKQLINRWQIQKVILPFAYVRPIGLIKNIFHARHMCNGFVHIVGEVHYIAIFLPVKTMITIHDLSFIDFNHGFKRHFFYWLWYYFPLRKATYVTCISQDVKTRLIKEFPFLKDKISVIYNPLDTIFTFKKKNFNINCPVILHIGTSPNKNLERVIDALKGVDCDLHIVGRKSEKYERLLKEGGFRYTYRSNLSDKDILHEYEQADIVSFPSLYEGFGMPIIEGQAVGRAVLTSNIDPMKEIAGEAALLVDPYSVSDIRNGFLSLINNEKMRTELIIKGVRNAAKFDAENIAEKYSTLYKKLHP